MFLLQYLDISDIQWLLGLPGHGGLAGDSLPVGGLVHVQVYWKVLFVY